MNWASKHDVTYVTRDHPMAEKTQWIEKIGMPMMMMEKDNLLNKIFAKEQMLMDD